MYTALLASDRHTPGRVATLLLGWHAMGQEQVHFHTAEDSADGSVWLTVSTGRPQHRPSDGFIYPDDLHPQTDPDVCAKIARLYTHLPVGGHTSARLRVRSALAPASAVA